MLLPSRLLLLIAAAWAGISVAAAFVPAWAPLWIYASSALLAAIIVDAVLFLGEPRPTVERKVAGALPVGVERDVFLIVSNTSRRRVPVSVFDHAPNGFETRSMPAEVRLPARGWARLAYPVRPVERGDHRFGPTDVRARSPLGLLERQTRAGEPETVRVYPNFAALTRFAIAATDNRLSQIGILQRRRRGEGMEFHQLRDYRIGDSLRSIDWKASSRMGRMIAREYEDERDQSIVFLLDCGRRMTSRDGELSHFDAALNAALLLAYVSLRQGDAVGILTMAGEARYIAPRKSGATVALMLNRLYDLQPTLRPPDYHRSAIELMQRVRKRSLVVVLSNLRDEDDDTLMPALALLRSRHLVLFANLREQILGRALSTHVTDFDRALTHAAAAEYLKARTAAFGRLERSGALVLDVEPPDLPVALVNLYLEIKRRGTL
jgi:uncharacterized protein (DUF58 family)